MNNIYLVGMMGAGKSVTGRHLAELLGRRFIETDQLIEEGTKKTIQKIFEEMGEPAFRKLESGVLKDVSRCQGAVVSLGGGAVRDRENLELIKSTGRMIYLRSKPETLWNRVRGGKERPLLNVAAPFERIKTLLKERAAHYEEADMIVDTDGKSPEAVAEEIRSLVETRARKN
ncbi:MAG: shikimate kinase [Candidatus Omnitrophica bacterium]|nr:shikimate kinase [Candidatus Omnitrophota bacterium]